MQQQILIWHCSYGNGWIRWNQKRIDPGEPMDKNLYDLPAEEQAKVEEVPATLEEAINNLGSNHEYLLDGNVFTKDLIESYIEYKREEIEPNKLAVTLKSTIYTTTTKINPVAHPNITFY